MNEQLRNYAGNRDGPIIFHMRDGPPNVTGPPCGTGPPLLSGSGPPTKTGPPMDWLAQKKTLERFDCYKNLDRKNKETKNLYDLTKVNKRKNTMKTSNRNKLLSLALTGSFSLFGASNAFAAAGATISNFATLSYDVGGSTQTVIESGSGPGGNSVPGVGQAVLLGITTDFIEDRKVNFEVVRGGSTGLAVPGGTLQSVQYTLTNNGNGSQGFLLKGLNNTSGTADPFGGTDDVFDATSVQTFVESGASLDFQPLEDTAAFVATLAAGASVDVYVVSTIPLDDGTNPLVDTNVAVMTLVAQLAIPGSTGIAADAIVADGNGNTSPGGTGFTNGTVNVTAGVASTIADDTTVEDIVFNDAAGTRNGTGVGGAVQNAQHADDSSYTIATAELTVTKTSVAMWDPINFAVSPKSIPGAYVTYTITIANAAGAADADLTTISDVLVAALDLDPDLVTNSGPGNPVGIAGESFILSHSGGTTNLCTGDVADGDVDGCAYSGGAGGTVDVDINAVMGAADAQLSAGESLTITFNAIVQ